MNTMSDSDDDDILGNVLTFPSQNTTMWGKGPNMTTNMTGLSFSSNVHTSTMQMPTNFARPLQRSRPRFMGTDFDQRSIHSRRDFAPMSNIDCRSNYNRWETSSMYGGGDPRPRNFYYRDSMLTLGSQKFNANGRSRSPFSVRSTGPSFRNNILTSTMHMPTNFEELRYMEHDFDQKSVHSRRDISPMSNIDHRNNYNRWETSSMYGGGDARPRNYNCRDSVRTMSSQRSVINGRSGSPFSVRSTASKASESARSIAMAFKEIKFDKEDLKIIKDAFSMYIDNKPPVNAKLQNASTQKQRFENGFLLPCHRFNKSTTVLPIQEADECARIDTVGKTREIDSTECLDRNGRYDSDSEQDEIFSDKTVREKTINGHGPERKRCLNDEYSIYQPDKKRHRLCSPVKANDRIKKKLPKQPIKNSNDKENGKDNNFEFVKPSLPNKPIRKTKDKLPPKSPQPILDTVQCVQSTAQTLQPGHEDLEKLIDEPSQMNSISDLSMRPSFIKRKLFTQKLDVTEKHNISGINSSMNSPQANIYSAIQNEKHKARKLVTSQSCLSRDVREGNNFLDLIHKIVPPEQMSITNQMNKTETTHNKNNSEDYDDKWDVTSIIFTCNDDNVSDTYTDEEIFTCKKKTNDMRNEQQMPASNKNNTTVVRNSNIRRLPEAPTLNKSEKLNKPEKIQTFEKENVSRKVAQNYVKSFWDIDSEGDDERTTAPKNISHNSEDQGTCNKTVNKEMTKNQVKNKPESKNNITVNNNLAATLAYKTFNTTHRILSHRSSKKKKSDEAPVKNDDSRSSLCGPQDKNSKPNQKNKSVSKKQTPLKNIKTSTNNDISQIANITINRTLRKCRLNDSHKDAYEKRNSNRILKITLTPIKTIKNKIQNNIQQVKEVKVRNSDVSFSIVSEKARSVVQKHADESPAKSKTQEKTIKTDGRKSDISFSLPSKKNTREKQKSARKNNSHNKSAETNYSMVLRSSSTSTPQKRTRREIKSKASTKANKSKIY